MRRNLLLAGIVVLLAVAVSVLVRSVLDSKSNDISSVIYESSYGYRIEMTRQQDEFFFSYIPSSEHDPVEQLRGVESYETVSELLQEFDLDSAAAVSDNTSGDDDDRLTVVFKTGIKHVLIRPESDDAFRSIRSCLMEFAGLCR